MPFVTKLRLTSGDRGALDRAVADVKSSAARKGVEFNGPHADPSTERRVPQSKRLSAHGGRFADWTYTVYARSIEIVGHDEFARSIVDGFPAGIHAEVEIDQVRSADSS